jgi:hypothetical protein
VANGALVNSGSSVVIVNYVRNRDGSFMALNPALHAKPGETVRLPATPGTAEPVSVPAEAVETAFDPERFAADFYVLNAEQIVERVVIKNTLPRSDPAYGAFDRLTLTVTATVEGDTTTPPAVMGPFDLSASGTRGGEISIPFLRLARGMRTVTVKGEAHYVGDSVRTLKPTTFDTLSISITQEMFRD